MLYVEPFIEVNVEFQQNIIVELNSSTTSHSDVFAIAALSKFV